MQLIIWLAIAVTVAHAAMFSGLNLAVLSVSRLRLEVSAMEGTGALPLRGIARRQVT